MNRETQARGELIPPAPGPTEILPAYAARIVPSPRQTQGGPPQAQAMAISPMGLVRALRRRSALALGVAVLLAGIAGPVAWFVAPHAMYRAQARLQIASQPPKILFSTVDVQNVSEYGRYQSTQVMLVKSRAVLLAALRSRKMAEYRSIREAEDPVEWLQEKLQIGFVGNSEVMEISLSAKYPDEVAGIVNAVTKAYMDEIVNVDLKRRMERYDRLKKIKEMYADLLGKKRETIRKLAESAGSDDRQTLALHQRYAMEQLQDLQREMRDVQSQKRRLEAQLKSALPVGPGEGAAEPEPLSEQEIVRLIDAHPAVVELAQQLEAQERQFDMAKARVAKVSRSKADPSIRVLYDDVQGLRLALERRRREVRPEVIRQALRRESIHEDQKGQEAQRELAMLGDLEQRLNQEINSFKLVNQSLTTNTLDIRKLQDDVAQIDMVSTSVAREVEALSLELEAPARIKQIDEATEPRTRDEKRRYMMIAMAIFGSFFGGLFGVAFLELQSRKVDTAEDVPVELGLPIVGALPMLPARTQRGRAPAGRDNDKDRYWRNVLLESVDATRTLLLHAARTGSYRVVMITSAVGGEGKTSLASYLATSLARSGLRTLLIDADLRRPMMHKLFDLPPAPGLSELLRDQVELEGALAATAVEDLTLLPAGHCDREALRILAKGGVAPLFERLKRGFDFIVVDSSPILPVADAMLIAQHADAALFSIIRDVSRKTKVKAASERLQHLGVPVLGAVVTGVHGGSYGNNYYDAGPSYSAGLPESVAVSADEEVN